MKKPPSIYTFTMWISIAVAAVGIGFLLFIAFHAVI